MNGLGSLRSSGPLAQEARSSAKREQITRKETIMRWASNTYSIRTTRIAPRQVGRVADRVRPGGRRRTGVLFGGKGQRSGTAVRNESETDGDDGQRRRRCEENHCRGSAGGETMGRAKHRKALKVGTGARPRRVLLGAKRREVDAGRQRKPMAPKHQGGNEGPGRHPCKWSTCTCPPPMDVN